MEITLPGLFVPPLTPFDRDGRVDYRLLERVVDYTLERCQPAAVVIAGVEAQEYQFLSSVERVQLIRRTAQFVAGRCPLVVGVSHPDYRQALELVGLASDLGASAVQVLIPARAAGGVPALDEIVEYFHRVGDGGGLPVVAYHNPGPGAEPGTRGMVEIAKLPFVRYVKDSSRDMTRIGQLIAEVQEPGHAQYLATAQVFLPSLMLGASGGTIPPPAARIGSAILQAFLAGNLQEGGRLQRVFRLYPARWMSYGLTAVMKAGARAEGEQWGDPHAPAQALSSQDEAELHAYLHQTGVVATPGPSVTGR